MVLKYLEEVVRKFGEEREVFEERKARNI